MNGRPTLDGIKQASQNALNKAQLMVGLKEEADIEAEQEPEPPSMLAEAADLLCPELTFQQRIIGFAVCFTVGYLITFMSFKFFVKLLEGALENCTNNDGTMNAPPPQCLSPLL